MYVTVAFARFANSCCISVGVLCLCVEADAVQIQRGWHDYSNRDLEKRLRKDAGRAKKLPRVLKEGPYRRVPPTGIILKGKRMKGLCARCRGGDIPAFTASGKGCTYKDQIG